MVHYVSVFQVLCRRSSCGSTEAWGSDKILCRNGCSQTTKDEYDLAGGVRAKQSTADRLTCAGPKGREDWVLSLKGRVQCVWSLPCEEGGRCTKFKAREKSRGHVSKDPHIMLKNSDMDRCWVVIISSWLPYRERKCRIWGILCI